MSFVDDSLNILNIGMIQLKCALHLTKTNICSIIKMRYRIEGRRFDLSTYEYIRASSHFGGDAYEESIAEGKASIVRNHWRFRNCSLCGYFTDTVMARYHERRTTKKQPPTPRIRLLFCN